MSLELLVGVKLGGAYLAKFIATAMVVADIEVTIERAVELCVDAVGVERAWTRIVRGWIAS